MAWELSVHREADEGPALLFLGNGKHRGSTEERKGDKGEVKFVYRDIGLEGRFEGMGGEEMWWVSG